ncbi:MAG TPA: SDR family NAD(P)-dependent oxidoreductase [Pirellulales bacterium]|jgi:NAD(P)-dependent dehydrogenase (short-subunit alcohol dehydrogenase family)|nr:SDR family NAD(P)-dependent oxidoreductase [Pirellulales bacterium]
MGYWQEKVVVVTGGSTGLGRAMAQGFAANGAHVVIAARTFDDLQATAAEIRRQYGAPGREVLPVACDVTKAEDVERLFAETLARFGRLDVLVNNAGRSARGQAIDTTPEEFQQLWELNFLGAVRCTRAAIKHLLAAGGHLINLGSLSAKSASRYLGAYPVSKHALAAYTQQLRLELAPHGLHVMLVCPGPVVLQDRDENRYEAQSAGLPESARKPGGGVKLGAIKATDFVRQLLRACEKRAPELVYPRRARLLFILSQISPKLGDWLLRRWT